MDQNNLIAVPNFPFFVKAFINVSRVNISGSHLDTIISFQNLFASYIPQHAPAIENDIPRLAIATKTHFSSSETKFQQLPNAYTDIMTLIIKLA